MKVVGVRELKDRLSEYLRMARSGEEVIVTDRGEVIAELRKVDPSKSTTQLDPNLMASVSQGSISLGAANDPAVYPQMPRLMKRHSVLQLLEEERREI
jgi:prevent-host-death family protein